MNCYLALTDWDWFSSLHSLVLRPDEVNFWQPGGNRRFRALRPGELLLFKLKRPRDAVVGGAVFAYSCLLPVSVAWEAFGERNGAGSLEELRLRIGRLRHRPVKPLEDYQIGCVLLEQPFFLDERDWIKAPNDWARQIVQGATYDLTKGEGKRIWRQLIDRAPLGISGDSVEPLPLFASEPRFGQPTTILPRLGQGTFRLIITDIYEKRCAVTGERTLPALEAAHIRPYTKNGPHDPRNGLLLRRDLHTLFDKGYVTVTPELRFEVSRRIKEEFENGREYYRLHGQDVRQPSRRDFVPDRFFLDWHASEIYRG